jgi:hypothetical protein
MVDKSVSWLRSCEASIRRATKTLIVFLLCFVEQNHPCYPSSKSCCSCFCYSQCYSYRILWSEVCAQSPFCCRLTAVSGFISVQFCIFAVMVYVYFCFSRTCYICILAVIGISCALNTFILYKSLLLLKKKISLGPKLILKGASLCKNE